MSSKLPLFAFVLFTISSSRCGGAGVDAFVASSPSPSLHVARLVATSSASATASPKSSSQLNFFSGYEMGGTDAVNHDKKKTKKTTKNDDDNDKQVVDSAEDPLFLVSLVTKAIIILVIKTAKDIVNYPPNLLDQYNRHQQMRNQEIASELNYKPEDGMMPPAEQAAAAVADSCREDTLVMATTTTEEDTTAVSSASASAYTPLPMELTKSNPFILLAKFLGVLAFKTMHDAIYYPALWINDYLHPPKNDNDDYYYYY